MSLDSRTKKKKKTAVGPQPSEKLVLNSILPISLLVWGPFVEKMVKCDITELVSLVSEVWKILPGALLSLLGRGKALQDITKLPWILRHEDGRKKQKPEEARPEEVTGRGTGDEGRGGQGFKAIEASGEYTNLLACTSTPLSKNFHFYARFCTHFPLNIPCVSHSL